MKKTFSILLSIVILISVIFCVDFFAFSETMSAYGSCGRNVKYSFNPSTGDLVISGTGDMFEYSDSFNTKPFRYQSVIKSVTIKSGVTSISDYAFIGCTSLSDVSISDSVTIIGVSAFSGCTSLKSIIMPNALSSIGYSAFSGCANLANITIPDSITNIGYNAFANTEYYNEESNWDNNVLYINNALIQAKENIIDYEINSNTCCIADRAFYKCTNLENIVIPASVSFIGNSSFSMCVELKNVLITNGVTNIGNSAFYGCKGLKNLTIPNSVIYIENNAFDGCTGIKEITIPCSAKIQDIQYTNEYAFDNCTNIEKVILTKGNGVMQNYSPFKNIDMFYPYQNTPWYISRNNIKELIIEDGVENIGAYAFYNCKGLTNLTIPNDVRYISNQAFFGCSGLKNVIIGDNVTSIGTYAFKNCTNITELTIGKNVNLIGNGAFEGLDSLSIINYTGTVEEWNNTKLSFDRNITCSDGIVCYSHNWEELQYINPTCTSNGKMIYTCSVCGNTKEIIEQETILEHDYYTKVTEPTCLNKGYTTYICSVCSNTYNSDYTNPLGHSYETVVTKPKCTEKGYTTYTCKTCNYNYIDNLVKSTGHTSMVDKMILPNCTKTGLTEGSHCSVCGEVLVAQESIPALGHNWTSWAVVNVPAGCKDGLSIRICNICNEIENLTIPATGTHNYVLSSSVAPTCSRDGKNTFTCITCQNSFVEIVPATNQHSYKANITKATISKNGSILYKCDCGNVKSTVSIYYPKEVILSATRYTYDGKVKKPTVKVVDSSGKAIAATNYTVTYPSGMKNIGKYTVKITFKGNYSGTETKTFIINPKGTSISSIIAASKGFTVKWKKQATQTTGYQIRYSTNSSMSSAKTVIVSSAATVSKKITKLTAKKKYYVQIRTYKTVNGTKYYSSWSDKKYVTTK